jgi:hypothetical protein
MNTKKPEIDETAKHQIAQIIPRALEKAWLEYDVFSDSAQDEKETKDYHSRINALKAALAHIELLLKLAALVDVVDENEAYEVNQIIHDAMNELRKS